MILEGNCIELLPTINDNSIDLIVTDPPYGIEFMGKDWDRAVVPVDIWKDCYRILKQGKLAFIMCSPRQDVLSRMIVNLQDAGFRTNYTSIYWTFASGFPKAANVSKLIDKRGGANLDKFYQIVKKRMAELGLSMKDLQKHFPSKTGKTTGAVYNWFEYKTNVPTVEEYNKLVEVLKLEGYPELKEAKREVIGQNKTKDFSWHDGSMMSKENTIDFTTKTTEIDITKAATEEAKKMEGAYVGFQPKPALEIILQVQKPFTPEGELTIITSECLYWIHCLSVNIAEMNLSLLQTVQDFIAQNTAMDKIVEEAIANIGKVGESFVQMDILKSILVELVEKQDTNWNTVLLWKSILVGLLAKVNKFTTETITEQIIELKTLNLLLSQSIPNNTTIQEKTFLNGNGLNASIVENILANALIRLLSTKTTTAPSNASQEEKQISPVKHAAKSSKSDQNTLLEKGNTVPQNVTTRPEVKVIIVVSKGRTISWLDDCRIPYQSEDDRNTAEYGAKQGLHSWNKMKVQQGDRKETVLAKSKAFYFEDTTVNEKGRFPANLIVSDDVLNNGEITKGSRQLKRKAGAILMGKRTYSNNIPYKLPEDNYGGYNDEGSYSRYFSLDQWAAKTFPFLIVPKPAKSEKGEFNNHPTVKSQKLMSYLITMGSREGDLVLDPFCGSGTTLLAAHQLHRKYLGIELNPEYITLAKERLAPMQSQLKMELWSSF